VADTYAKFSLGLGSRFHLEGCEWDVYRGKGKYCKVTGMTTFIPGFAQHIPIHWAKAEGFCNQG